MEHPSRSIEVCQCKVANRARDEAWPRAGRAGGHAQKRGGNLVTARIIPAAAVTGVKRLRTAAKAADYQPIRWRSAAVFFCSLRFSSACWAIDRRITSRMKKITTPR